MVLFGTFYLLFVYLWTKFFLFSIFWHPNILLSFCRTFFRSLASYFSTSSILDVFGPSLDIIISHSFISLVWCLVLFFSHSFSWRFSSRLSCATLCSLNFDFSITGRQEEEEVFEQGHRAADCCAHAWIFADWIREVLRAWGELLLLSFTISTFDFKCRDCWLHPQAYFNKSFR